MSEKGGVLIYTFYLHDVANAVHEAREIWLILTHSNAAQNSGTELESEI